MWSHDAQRASTEDVSGSTEGVAPGRRTRSERLPVQRKAIASTATDLIAPSAGPDLRGLDDPFGFHLSSGPVQRKAGAADSAAASSSGGSALPAPVQAKMERAFGTDLSAVRVHEGPEAQAMGALAYTQGTDIHFAPGQYQPESHAGQELLGHELTHVVQQGQGRVAATSQAKGMGLNDDEGLEHEADVAGARAARGEIAMTGGAVASGGAVVQAKYKLNPQKTNELKRKMAERWSDIEEDQRGEVAQELADYCDGHGQAVNIIEKATYDQFQSAVGSMTAEEFEYELITGGGSKGSGKKEKVKDPLADVRSRITKAKLDLTLFSQEDLEAILRDKDDGGWDLAIQTTYQRVKQAKENADLRVQLISRYATARAAGNLIFTGGLLKAAWDLAYTIATSPGASINTTLGGEYSDGQLIAAAGTWNGQPDLDGQVTNIHVPGSPHHVIQDKSTRPVNPDPTRGRQTDFISYWGGNKINVHANSDVHH